MLFCARWMKTIAIALAYLVVFVAVAEYYVRYKGYIPASSLEELQYETAEEPPRFDPRLGWAATANKPMACGEPIPLFNTLHAKIWSDEQRASRPLVWRDNGKRVLVLGCSIAFGYGLPDNQTFTWLLNKRFPGIVFENYAFPGYSTFQCMLKEEMLLANRHYDLIIYTPFNDHVARNVSGTVYTHSMDGTEAPLTYMLKINNALWYLPVTELNSRHEIVEIIPFYQHWPLDRYLAITNTLKRIFLFYDDIRRLETVIELPPPREAREIYWRLLKRMNKIANEHGSQFAVLCLENEEEYPDPLAYPSSSDIVRMNENCQDTLEFPPPYTYRFISNGCNNEPDGPKYRVGGDMSCHPNAIVHANWAKIIGDWFESQYLDGGLLKNSKE